MARRNTYSQHLSNDFYNSCPKAVFAALAVSLMANHCATDVDVVEPKLLEEWYILYKNGIVPQCPPERLRKILPGAEQSETIADNVNL